MNVLDGRRIGILRGAEQGGGLVRRLQALGAEPVHCPVIAIVPPASYAPLDAALATAAEYDWLVFTSANAVAAVAERLAARSIPLPPTLRIAAIGPATAAALTAHLREADLIAPDAHSESLATALADARGSRMLIPAGNLAQPGLAAALATHATVDVVTAYRTVPAQHGIAVLARELAAGGLDALVFTSGSTVRYLAGGLAPSELARLRAIPPRPAVVCIGPVTAAVADQCGIAVAAVADPHTTEGVIDALGCWFDRAG